MSAPPAGVVRYGKRADVIVHEREPFNAETCHAALAESAVTPTDAFYVRGHGTVPDIDPGAWRLHVGGLVERELDLSLSTLKEAFREREVVATLQCAGNRRAGLIAIRDIPGEAPWGPGATGTARWAGVALADVLALAGPLRDAAHVGFDGADMCPEAKPAQRFGGSIPLDKARRPEVLLAWAMNGEPLAPVHGAPVRVVVPGYIGARSVKWLERIEVRAEPWHGLLPARRLPAAARGRHARPGEGDAARDRRAERRRARAGRRGDGRGRAGRGARLRVRRRRTARRAGRRVARRRDDVAAGRAARGPRALGVAAVAHDLDLAPGEHEILVRAWDSSAAPQPEDEAALWNPKGYVNNARPRVRVRAE